MRIFLIISFACLTACNFTYSVDDYAKVKKIDTHVHLSSASPAFAEAAKADNFDLITVNVDSRDAAYVYMQEALAQRQVEQAPDQVRYVTTILLDENLDDAWAAKTIQRLSQSFKDGAVGVKIWKNVGMSHRDAAGKLVMIDDPRFDPVIRFIISEKKTLLGHLGEPKNCWLPLDSMTVNNDRSYFREHPQYHMFLHPEYPSYEDHIAARDRFVARYPELRFVGAHLGSLEWSVDELAKRLDLFPNMAVDMAARICHLQHQAKSDHEKVRAFIIKYQDRLIYATDAGISERTDAEKLRRDIHDRWMQDWKFFVSDEVMSAAEVNGEFRGLNLPREVVDKIYRGNAIRWFALR